MKFEEGSFITFITNPTQVYKVYEFNDQTEYYHLGNNPELGARWNYPVNFVEANFRLATDSEVASYYNTNSTPNNVKQT